MGCFHSKDATLEERLAQEKHAGRLSEPVVPCSGRQPSYLRDAAPGSVLLTGGSTSVPASPTAAAGAVGAAALKYAVPSPRGSVGDAARSSPGSFILGAGSVTARRTPIGKNGAHVSADLNAIVDDQGTINAVVSRQLSVMSHYSVKSEAGSVILQPELVQGPNPLGFTLQKLIGRGGFGNVYLGEWELRKVAVKVVTGSNEGGDQVCACMSRMAVASACAQCGEGALAKDIARQVHGSMQSRHGGEVHVCADLCRYLHAQSSALRPLRVRAAWHASTMHACGVRPSWHIGKVATLHAQGLACHPVPRSPRTRSGRRARKRWRRWRPSSWHPSTTRTSCTRSRWGHAACTACMRGPAAGRRPSAQGPPLAAAWGCIATAPAIQSCIHT